jgi:hypothetical protein
MEVSFELNTLGAICPGAVASIGNSRSLPRLDKVQRMRCNSPRRSSTTAPQGASFAAPAIGDELDVRSAGTSLCA